MVKYRVDLSYRGTEFNGWQSQADGSGVQDHVETVLGTFLRHPVKVVGSSRTDSGVHAAMQVACFESDELFEEARWLHSFRSLASKDIGIRSIKPIAKDFHPIRGAVAKTYCYRIWRGKGADPFLADFVWRMVSTLDLQAMRVELASLIGNHDFTAFCAIDSGARTKSRTIIDAKILVRGEVWEIWILGTGFLKQMVRSIVGTVYQVGVGRLPSGTAQELLKNKLRTFTALTAPASGLMLMNIDFEVTSPLPSTLTSSFPF